KLGRILVVQNDVDALAGDLVGHRLHARTPHPDARSDGVDPRVIALDCNFCANSRIASRAEDLDEALSDLRHLELEQLNEELRGGTREKKLRTSRLGTDLFQVRLDAILRPDRLARDHLVARNKALRVADRKST